LSDFSETLIFSTDFGKNTQTRNFMKIRPVGAKMLHADGQTWRSSQSLFTILWMCLTM